MTQEKSWNRVNEYFYRSSNTLSMNIEVKSSQPIAKTSVQKAYKQQKILDNSDGQSKKKHENRKEVKPNIFDEIFKTDKSLPKCFLHVELLPDIPKLPQQDKRDIDGTRGLLERPDNKAETFKVKNNSLSKYNKNQNSCNTRHRTYRDRNDYKAREKRYDQSYYARNCRRRRERKEQHKFVSPRKVSKHNTRRKQDR